MSGFTDRPRDQKPPVDVFIQWKGTDVCFDFHCDCGAHSHFDGDFAYFYECPGCRQLYEMPCYIYPRKVEDTGQNRVTDEGYGKDPSDFMTWLKESNN